VASLFDIADEIERFLLSHMDPETGEFEEGFEAELERLEMAKEQKVLAIARYALGEKAEGDMVRAQVDRLLARARAHFNKADRLKEWIHRHTDRTERYEDDVVRVRGQKNPVSVRLPATPDLKSWPKDFVRVSLEADKSALKGALIAGEDVPEGVALVKDDWHTRIE
jgi:hypothetical protein